MVEYNSAEFMIKKKIFIIIPVFNEESVLRDIINKVRKEGYTNILVIDDGSTDNSYGVAKKQKVIVLRHLINRGKGAAIKTGFEAAKILNASAVVTFDGDGQHSPNDITNLIKKVNAGYDVVLGTRSMNIKTMPFIKLLANFTANFITMMIYGLWVHDSQCGLRAYSKKALSLINTKNDRYEYDSEIIREISRHKLRYTEVPIQVHYTRYSTTKVYKQSLPNGIRAVTKMILSL